MDAMIFWILVFPVLLLAGLVWLGLAVVGAGTIRAALKSRNVGLRAGFVVVGVMLIAAPILYLYGADHLAQRGADARQEALAGLPRADLSGRLPARFIAVGNFQPDVTRFIETRYRLTPYPEAENRRLVDAYRAFRKAELCRRRFGDAMTPGTRLPVCKPLPDSVQSALDLRAPLLVFAEGSATSMREDNVIAGKLYEIRLVTPKEDLLVAYFEERTVRGGPSLFNPFAPPRSRASTERPPTLTAFIETALEGASR